VVAAAPPSAPPAEPLLPRDEALAQGRALAASWKDSPSDAQELATWLRALDEAQVRRVLTALAHPCLEARDREAPACHELAEGKADEGVALMMVALLGELADPSPLGGATTRLLVRLDARGLWGAGSAAERILERRMLAHLGTCAPPSAAEIDAARRSLGDLALLTPGDATVTPPGATVAARWPTAAELDDLAYFYATVADSGPEVGSAPEATGAKELPAGHPDLEARARMREEARAALLDGALERHVDAAEAYLRTLGYPGPLRLAEEGDERWGGAGASYVLRDTARSAELLGRYELAEALYRRAAPGGGMCGTSTPTRHDEQIKGAIRAAEQRRGCRGAVADRLFTVASDGHHAYGPERLASAGFDVPRLYAAALLTLGRDDAAAVERALQVLPSRAGEASARLSRLGPEAWATRVRAVPGYADTAKGAGLDRLFGLAERGPADARAPSLLAIGVLLEDHGPDPCRPRRTIWGSSHSSSRLERRVRGVMDVCATRLDGKTVDAAVRRLAAPAADPDPGVREAAARALGQLGSPRARPALARLARDPFDNGGKVCTTRNGGPEVCEPNRPVALAARDALEALARAEKARAEQRLQVKEKGRPVQLE
jgi:hypothetical protein